ncbi:pyruvate dehydrogenase complex E1 component subunit beta [Candidatus Sneabacter namystus]|uniref:Pyruvate dehydrogenase E1 component subunit beta n=1 Tax=Candidatus Sneabacter namystus TaxID=2601646 RepID=A0A5C0UJD6_9RICK|nr:pyruvate dehydrogenase complex E1 component subunit beta [Candidatus Sneabacter namystus]QEK39623.1 pyruvate dehydrogenase complex E1 component subunit beta [Candidatus Sneabacter namystus]
MVVNSITVREAIRDAIAEEMELDDRVFIMGEEVGEYQGAYKATQGLLQRFGPKRVIDTPISEHAFAGVGVGAAFAGLKPIVEFMTFNFAMQAIDHIVNSAAKTLYMSGGTLNCPIVFRGPNGAAASVGAQHSQNYTSWFSHIPGLKVFSPYCAHDSKSLLKTAIKDPNPVVFLENELMYGVAFDNESNFKDLDPGVARIRAQGNDVTIITFSRHVGIVLKAAEELRSLGISAEVIDLRTIVPLDEDNICSSVKNTGRVVVVEEGWFTSGVGATIASILMQNVFDYLDAPVEIVSGVSVPLPYAKNLEQAALPDVCDIVTAVKRVMNVE